VLTAIDEVLRDTAVGRGRPDAFQPTDVAVFFGKPGVTVADPFFDGDGPDRTGCTLCGGCMLGCRVGAKNTLDKNYLWLARARGLTLHANTEIDTLQPESGGGYRVAGRRYGGRRGNRVSYTARQVILAGGVLGTVELMLRAKADPAGLPKLSERVGRGVRTNSEAIVGVVSPRTDRDLSKGVAIGSIYQIDDRAHIEPVRYPAGSGLFRWFIAPHATGTNPVARLLNVIGAVVRHPIAVLRAYLVRDHARQSTMLLFMRTAEGTLRLKRSRLGGLATAPDEGACPTASIPEATELAHEVARRLEGTAMSLITETLMNIPTTAHILGGCCMGDSIDTGVIDRDHRVFGYDGLYVMDGSAVSANPGVNPSLTIAAMAERAVAGIPANHVAAVT
jgi:cholesterol oxidase